MRIASYYYFLGSTRISNVGSGMQLLSPSQCVSTTTNSPMLTSLGNDATNTLDCYLQQQMQHANTYVSASHQHIPVNLHHGHLSTNQEEHHQDTNQHAGSLVTPQGAPYVDNVVPHINHMGVSQH